MDTILPMIFVINIVLLILVFVYIHHQNIKLNELLKMSRKPFVSTPGEHQEAYLPYLVHELRAPISVIKGASDLMLKEAASLTSDQIQTLLSQIRTSSGSLLKLINDVLDVSKIEAGKFAVTKSPGDIVSLLKEECNYFEPLAKVRKINLLFQAKEAPLVGSFDPERLQQVMNNLLSNALKFVPHGGTVRVTVEKDIDNKSIRICVMDNGVGVPSEEKNLLFHEFSQIHNQNMTTERGTGLGLVVCKAIIEAHGGKIWMEDMKPHGSNFCFVIPYEN